MRPCGLPPPEEPPGTPPVTDVSAIAWADPARHADFDRWFAGVASRHGLDPATLRPASADASFRRYFRAEGTQGPRIVMDAPPAQEDCRPFVTVARLLTGAGLHAPQVLEWDEAAGFMLLDDLGSCTYLTRLDVLERDPQRADPLYRDALDALVRLQGIDAQAQVKPYDRAFMQREMDLYPEWYAQRHRGKPFDAKQQQVWSTVCTRLLDQIATQPVGLVHRDYHCRNLMVCAPREAEGAGPAPNPGILDFQDAVWGPLTYDLVSLLRDAYVDWDEPVQIDWAVRWWQSARAAGLPVREDFGEVWRDLEWMGLQRHLKVLGIFARLSHRDGKHGYLADLPRVWRHAHKVCMRYTALAPMARLLEQVEGEQAQTGYTF